MVVSRTSLFVKVLKYTFHMIKMGKYFLLPTSSLAFLKSSSNEHDLLQRDNWILTIQEKVCLG